ncbi:SulP family inorganic anion transporter [Akkermansiaceae bacterium]|nr:SulP family inorganic anion transporter [Akkermansiaceae bacterium]
MEKALTIIKKTAGYFHRIYQHSNIKFFPAGSDIIHYNKKKAYYDFKAALNTALLGIPQGMAYAAIAEVPIINGIICAIIASIVAPIFASSQHTIIGPTNATAFMLFSFFAESTFSPEEKIIMLPTIVCMVGIFSIIGAYLKFAEMIQYVSRSVLVGYLTGAAVLIILNQMKHLFGVSSLLSDALSAISGSKPFYVIARELSYLLPQMDWRPLILGVGTLITYLFLNKKFKSLPTFAITLGLAIVVAALTNIIPSGDPEYFFKPFVTSQIAPRLPDFSFFHQAFWVAFAIMFLASLENTVMSKSLASRTGAKTDVNQDMLSVGIANLAASFFAPMAASGSLTRSALNFSSGAKTRIASIFSGLLCSAGLAILILSPKLFGFGIVEKIPKSALAGLVIAIAITLIKWKNIKICLRTTHDDAVVILVTFAATLLTRLDYAIFVGVAVSISLFLRKASRPLLAEYEVNPEGNLLELDKKQKRSDPAISIVHVEGELFFGAAELFRTQIAQTTSDPNLKVIILRLKNARNLDATSIMALEELITQMRKTDRHVLMSGVSKDIYKVLKKSGLIDTIQHGCIKKEGQTNIFIYSPSNPNLSTRDALIRAKELIGTENAEIKIFYDTSK